MQQLMWFRSDLRTQDNTALSRAMSSGATIALYLVTPGQWQRHDDAASKVDFWLRNLAELSKALAALNVPLLVRHCHDWSEAPLQVAEVCHEHDISAVHVNEEYGVNESLRDQQVCAYLGQQAIAWHSHLDQLLFKPGSVLTRSGGYFQVYSQFRKVCYERLHTALPALIAPPKAQTPLAIGSEAVPETVEGFATPSASLPPAGTWHEGDHTTHFAVLDAEGNAVAATLSINLPFGAAFTVPGTGVLLNDEMDDFAADVQGANAYGLTGSQANAIAGGKRPLSSMSPSFIESSDEFAAFGTPGGSRIPSMVLLSMLEYLDDQPIERWPAVARYHHQFLPDVIEHEPDTFSDEQIAELQRRGHELKRLDRHYGNQQVLFWDKVSGEVKAASDPRGIGTATP